jgi:hypothetical protein
MIELEPMPSLMIIFSLDAAFFSSPLNPVPLVFGHPQSYPFQ